jgi:hypothetical protein
MWTQAHREIYKQSGTGLPSDLTDAQWGRLEPLIPAAKPGGRPQDRHARGTAAIGLHAGRCTVPDDFDTMDQEEIEKLFYDDK